MSRLVLLTLAAIACLDVVYGYGSGAPNGSCVDMIPQHHTPPQTSVMPYTVVPLKKSITPGEKLSLLITPTAAVKEFKGFLVQARVGDTPVGQFTPGNGVKVIDCGTGKANAATHVKADSKTKITLQWTAPPNLSETVKFYATVAKNGGEFWVKKVVASVQVKAK